MNIKININETKEKWNRVWNFGFNTCHAALWLRDDMPSHALRAQKEAGFKYVRFHNTISKHIKIYNEDENGNPVIDFSNFDKVFDKVIGYGYIPFFEVGFCPPLLSQHKGSLCYYEADPSIPKSYDKWNYLIRETVKHIVGRYGLECAKRWYFEVWNEPDLFFEGTQEQYFELYDNTVTTIKSVCSDLKVGGPATSKCLWINEFIEHIEEKNMPCDFISTHAYPSDLPFLDSDYGEVSLQNSRIMYELFKKTRERMNNSSLKELPLIMGEWNSSAGPFASNHDEKNNAPFIVKMFDDLDGIIDGSLYWNLSDIYEEQGFHYIPYHGGYGMFNINDIPKSSYNAFVLLNKFSGYKVASEISDVDISSGAMTAYDKENGILSILMYNYIEPDMDKKDSENVKITISGISSETVCERTFSICDEGGSVYEWWQKLGQPDFVNEAILHKLNEKSKMVEDSKIIRREKENDYLIKTELRKGDVQLIQLHI